ncbi:MAG: hypothetical protein ABW178_09725 [Pseudoxanthomonas sp.]
MKHRRGRKHSRWARDDAQIGEKNVKGDYLPQVQFDAMSKPFKELLPELTLADCEGATANKQAFYRCMSNDDNHVMACAQQHRL